jgi:molybdate transport system substrate-binding protein
MKKITAAGIAAACLCLLAACAPDTPSARQLRVFSSNGVRAPLEEAQAAIESVIGMPLDIEFSTAASLTERIEAGEPFDVAILTPALIERLVDGGYIVSGESRDPFARTGVGVGARSGEITADISTTAGFRDLLLGASSVAYTAQGQSRRTIDAAFAQLGIAAALEAKAVILGPGEGPLAVAAGDAELVLTLISEILPIPELELVGPFPENLQGYVNFAAGTAVTSDAATAGATFIQQLASPTMADALQTHGLEAQQQLRMLAP